VADPLLSVRDLRVSFRTEDRAVVRAVDGVSLDVNAGETVGIVGESGCGKTTIARAIIGQVQPDDGAIYLNGERLSRRRTITQRRAVQMVFQDPYSSLNPRLTVQQTLRELLHVHRLVPSSAADQRCQELLAMVGLPERALHSYPSQFSGGQRQRIAIARALAVEPRAIVADEPVSALDVSVQATILQLFAELRVRLGLTLVLISHDLAVVRHLCDRIAVMYLGRIAEQGSREVIFDNPRHPYTSALLTAAPRIRRYEPPEKLGLRGEPPGAVDIPAGCRFHPRCPIAEDICATEDPRLLAVDSDRTHLSACHFRARLGAGG
jgi:oligopeptide/dipeptide ABC transporter ATP-binding protein